MEKSKKNRQNDPLVEVKNLSFQYLGSPHKVLDDINLDIRSNEIVLIAGHSGSGKSTLLRAINGLIPHQHSGNYEGSVLVDGLMVSKTNMSELAKKVGYVFQNPENQIFMFSVERDIAFGLENLRWSPKEMRERIDAVMDLLEIKQLGLRSPHELSDGQKQRVAIAGVIAMEPQILILDEPTSLLDPFTAKSVVELVADLRNKLGITVLLVEHRLDLVAKIATRMIVMDKGKVVLDGTPKGILSKVDVSNYGVSEPMIVRLAKLLGLAGEGLPIDPSSLYEILKVRQVN
ncbi:MAG: energy-coupling factor ABC transporter ATP-binding protein [Nitrososphaerales archaeon]